MFKFDNKDNGWIESANKNTFHRIVLDHLFPQIKFLDKDEDLKYSNEEGTICHFIFHNCKIQYQSMSKKLWTKAKVWICNSIGRLRSEKCCAMRNTFYSKSVCVLITFILIFTF